MKQTDDFNNWFAIALTYFVWIIELDVFCRSLRYVEINHNNQRHKGRKKVKCTNQALCYCLACMLRLQKFRQSVRVSRVHIDSRFFHLFVKFMVNFSKLFFVRLIHFSDYYYGDFSFLRAFIFSIWLIWWLGKNLWIYGQNTQNVKYIVGRTQKPLLL